MLPKGKHEDVCHRNKLIAQLSLTCWRDVKHAAHGDALGCSFHGDPLHCTISWYSFPAYIYMYMYVFHSEH